MGRGFGPEPRGGVKRRGVRPPALSYGRFYSTRVTPRNQPVKLHRIMSLLDFSAISAAPAANEPYRHFLGDHALRPGAGAAVMADFPEIREPGFYPVTDLATKGRFAELIDELNAPEFSRVVGEKLEMDLVSKPKLITIRRWSAKTDGNIHTDSLSKIATTLLYFNEAWADNGAGRLRVLRGPKDFNDYAAEVSPTVGTIFGFRRADNSWHGHLPFAGERKVVQITWLIDDSKVAHKTRTARFTRLLKKINPFG
jgi:hypothetical protein